MHIGAVADVGVIGGADGPTAIFVTYSPDGMLIAVAAAAIVAAALLILRRRRK